jgi:hypothetical protein
MATNEEYWYKTFGELFNVISFDYEPQYEPTIHTDDKGITYVTFYKTTITSIGQIERKSSVSTFDPKLFWKVLLMAKLLMDDPTVKVLYGS